MPKGSAPDAGNAVRNGDAGQVRATFERTFPDIGDAIGDDNAGQAGARMSSELHADASYRQTIYRFGYCHDAIGSFVSGDGDCSVVGLVEETATRIGDGYDDG